MAFFQRGYYAPEQTFTNLFRLLDDFDTYSREASNQQASSSGNAVTNGSGHHHRHQKGCGNKAPRTTSALLGRPFNPRFDVRETETTYELHGELAGVDRKDVSIEFTEPQTLVVSGRIERNYSAGTPLEDDAASAASASEAATATPTPATSVHSHQATVEDEKDEEGAVVVTKENNQQEVAATSQNKEVAAAAKPAERFWVQERAVGEFHRTFNFPQPVDETNVTAGLENGILSISIPKLKRETRRIALL